jgi:hypothetical protein
MNMSMAFGLWSLQTCVPDRCEYIEHYRDEVSSSRSIWVGNGNSIIMVFVPWITSGQTLLDL